MSYESERDQNLGLQDRRSLMTSRLIPLREPAVGIEPTTARLRIECSTTELRWRSCCLPVPPYDDHGTCPGTDSNRDALRHHPLKMACLPISPPGQHALQCLTGLTGLEPATSGVTDRHSNQAELQPPTTILRLTFSPHSPKGSRTPLCTLKECRPNR